MLRTDIRENRPISEKRLLVAVTHYDDSHFAKLSSCQRTGGIEPAFANAADYTERI